MAIEPHHPSAFVGPPVAQPVLTPFTASAVILLLTIDAGGEPTVNDLFTDLTGLARTGGFRSPEGGLALVAGVGSDACAHLCSGHRPAELQPFELMLRRMFPGDPPGTYDRILDYSTAVTRTPSLVPTTDILDDLPHPIGAG